MARAGMSTKPFVVLCVCLGLGSIADLQMDHAERVNGRRGTAFWLLEPLMPPFDSKLVNPTLFSEFTQ